MGTDKKLVIGLFGFGVVGEGLYRVLHQTPSLKAEIRKVCIKHPGKRRNAPPELFTTEKRRPAFDRDINVIVEVIDDSGSSLLHCKNGVAKWQAVVSAKKKKKKKNDRRTFAEILSLQKETGLPFCVKWLHVLPFLLSATWKNITITTCCMALRQS